MNAIFRRLAMMGILITPLTASAQTACPTNSGACTSTCDATNTSTQAATCGASCTSSAAAACGASGASSCGTADFIPFDPLQGPGHARHEDGLIDLSPILEPIREVFRVPGLAAALVRDGQLDAIGTAGIRRVGSDQSLSITDPFHLGSCGKAVTATVAARLVEAGAIEWEQTIGEAFPEFETEAHAKYLDVTLRQLLAHRGGFHGRDGAFDEAIARFEGELPDQRFALVRHSVSTAPAYEPGTSFVYSDVGYSVAGAMLERATGKAWEELVESHLAEPLGLESLGFGGPGASAPEFSPRGHLLGKDGLVPTGVGPGEDLANPAIGPAGTIHMSLRDWATFAQLHLSGARGEQGDFLSRRGFASLHGDPFQQGYALGWVLAPNQWGSGTTLTHTGSCGAWSAQIFILPAQNAALLLTANYGGGSGFRALQLAAERIGEEFLRR